MKRFAIALLCTGLASPGWALSCLAPDILRTYEMARDADEGFWIVRGRIFADGAVALPKPDADGGYGQDARASTPVVFSGLGLRSDGTYMEFSRPVTLTIACFAHWCGSAPSGEEIFAAIEVRDSGPELLADPCSSRIVPYSEEAEERLLSCLRKGTCSQN